MKKLLLLAALYCSTIAAYCSSPTFTNVTVTGSFGLSGGAIYNSAGTLVFSASNGTTTAGGFLSNGDATGLSDGGGGSVNLSAGNNHGGGSIDLTNGGGSWNGTGFGNMFGGSINTSAGAAGGGNIDTSNGGFGISTKSGTNGQILTAVGGTFVPTNASYVPSAQVLGSGTITLTGASFISGTFTGTVSGAHSGTFAGSHTGTSTGLNTGYFTGYGNTTLSISSGTAAWNVSNGNSASLTVTGSSTVVTISNAVAGFPYFLRVNSSTIASPTITFPAGTTQSGTGSNVFQCTGTGVAIIDIIPILYVGSGTIRLLDASVYFTP